MDSLPLLQPKPRLSTAVGIFWLTTLVAPVSQVLADVSIYQIDPAQSYLTLQGSTSGVNWSEQASGSLKSSFGGWLAIDFSSPYLSFLPGSTVTASPSGNWQPGPKGSVTASPADFGGKVTVGSGLGANHLLSAVRNLEFNLSGDGIPYGGGNFDASGITFSISTNGNAVVDYRANGLVIAFGEKTLGGDSVVNSATGGLMPPIFAEVASIVIPVDLELPPQTTLAGDTTFHLTGQLVGVRGVAILRPLLIWVPSPQNPQQFTLVWESNYKLQTTATLSPPNWIDTGAVAPYDVTLDGSSGFFRVTR